MRKVTNLIFKITGVLIIILCVGFSIWFMSGEGVDRSENITWGVTFFPNQAKELGLDWNKVYLSLLDDMNVKHFRLAVPWNTVEKREGEYNFSDIDWMVSEAQKRGAKVILAVGRKLFRWPECHDPAWLYGFSEEKIENKTLEFVRESVEHFRHYDNIIAWQIENEPGFPFGECVELKNDKDLFKKEVALARSLDSRPIVSTDSGELATWLGFSAYVDKLGVSLYRVTDNPVFGKFYYPMRPGFYQKKAKLVKIIYPNIEKVFLSELQLEPWTIVPLSEVSLKEQFKSMNFSRVQSTVEYASRTGFDEIYLWGVEWWYWLRKEHSDDRFWQLGKTLMK